MLQRYLKCTFLFMRNSEVFYYKTCRNICAQASNDGLPMFQAVSSASELSSNPKRSVPLTTDEFLTRKSMRPLQPENPRLLRVSILGEPNVGKSTLTNRLVKWRVCAVSSKVHTTRTKARAVLVEDNTQIVFLDTPGFVSPEMTKKFSLEPSFVMDPKMSIREADLLAVVIDIADRWKNHTIPTEILKILYEFKDKKSILILNKIDALKNKSILLSLTRILTGAEKKKLGNDKGMLEKDILNLINSQPVRDVNPDFYENIENKRGWPMFSQVFMVSALKNDGVEDLRDYLLNEAVPREWIYHEGTVTDQHPHDIALTTVKEKLLEYLPHEIPYKLQVNIVKWEILSTGCPKIDINIKCPNSRHRSFVIGPDGKHIAACVDKVKKALKESFRTDVVLKIAVK